MQSPSWLSGLARLGLGKQDYKLVELLAHVSRPRSKLGDKQRLPPPREASRARRPAARLSFFASPRDRADTLSPRLDPLGSPLSSLSIAATAFARIRVKKQPMTVSSSSATVKRKNRAHKHPGCIALQKP